MKVTGHFEQLHFSDSRCTGVTDEASHLAIELDYVAVLASHPDNKTGAKIHLVECALQFVAPKVGVRDYDSSTKTWTRQSRPYSPIDNFAEVTIAGGSWTLTGFDTEGRWLEWKVDAVSVFLDGRVD